MFQELMVMENSNNCTTPVGTQCMNEMMMPTLSWAPPIQVHKHQIPGILALGLVLGLNPKPSKQLWKIIRRFRAVRVSCRYENHDSSQQQLQKFIVTVEKGHLLYTLSTAGNPAKCTKFHSNFVCLLPSSSQFETEIVGGTQIASANLASCGDHHKCWKQQAKWVWMNSANPDYYREATGMWDQTPKRLYGTKVFFGGI